MASRPSSPRAGRDPLGPFMTQANDRIFTFSNALSLFRVVLTIPLIWVLELDQLNAALVIIVLAVLSDYFDGYLARRAHDITNVGKLLDPIADKFIMLAVMIFLILDPVRQFPIFFFLLLGLRDITTSIIASYLMDRESKVFETNLTGKWFVAVTALSMTLYVLKYTTAGLWVLLVATLLLLASWFLYVRRYSRHFKALSRA